MATATYYHAGCPVCLTAEETLIDHLSVDVEKVHLGEQLNRIAEAESTGVKSVPALVLNGTVLHINHGADLSALK